VKSTRSNQEYSAQGKTISSAYTFWIKFVYPTLWIPGFGFGTFILWSGLAHGKNGGAPPEVIKDLFAIIWVTGTAFFLWLGIQLKRVRIDAQNLYVSQWFREITVPIREISNVTENRWINLHPVTIHFKKVTACGRSVMFMPTIRLALWSAHPIVAELQRPKF
jgi:hypothetical protein